MRKVSTRLYFRPVRAVLSNRYGVNGEPGLEIRRSVFISIYAEHRERERERER
jgi:hypothetical protein